MDRDTKQKSLYEQWQSDDDEQALSELVNTLDPIVEQKVQDITPPDLSEDVVRNRVRNEVVSDLPDWDPEQGKVTTFLNNFTFPKINRYVNTFQNTARIPEARQQKISTFDEAKERLEDEKGRPPSDTELADDLGWDVREVQRMKQSRWDDVPASNLSMLGNMDAWEFSETEDVYHYLIYELDPEEETVFKHLTGYKGAEELTGKEIAEKMGVSPAKVSKIKKRIEGKMEEYL